MRRRAYEISEDTEVSKIQMISGSSTSISTPLKRCAPETREATGQR